jgi:hypothetical protein
VVLAEERDSCVVVIAHCSPLYWQGHKPCCIAANLAFTASACCAAGQVFDLSSSSACSGVLDATFPGYRPADQLRPLLCFPHPRPAESVLVVVASGHRCWLGSSPICPLGFHEPLFALYLAWNTLQAVSAASSSPRHPAVHACVPDATTLDHIHSPMSVLSLLELPVQLLLFVQAPFL